MKIIEGGITAPKGYKAAGKHTGVKKEKKDLALIESSVYAEAAGCFTANKVKAAPVLWDISICESGEKIRGIVVNSGNANACTGKKGIEDNKAMANSFAKSLGVEANNILVCSTGVIGVPMPIDKIIRGIEETALELGSSPVHAENAAAAIMTTDTFIKEIAAEFELAGKTARIAGIAKGSGMIHPNMATMLAFLTSDAAISRELLAKALKKTAETTFNMISVDGDTSTNDTLLALANGAAENPLIEEENEDYKTFCKALEFVCKKLAKDIARDGEGATKLMEVTVKQAKTERDARLLARSVVSSSLFKAALFGADANFGRVLCAMGYSGGDFDTQNVSIIFKSYGENNDLDQITLMENSIPVGFDEGLAKKILNRKDIFIDIFLNNGDFCATAWGCDLTYNYVKINGDYRS